MNTHNPETNNKRANLGSPSTDELKKLSELDEKLTDIDNKLTRLRDAGYPSEQFKERLEWIRTTRRLLLEKFTTEKSS